MRLYSHYNIMRSQNKTIRSLRDYVEVDLSVRNKNNVIAQNNKWNSQLRNKHVTSITMHERALGENSFHFLHQ